VGEVEGEELGRDVGRSVGESDGAREGEEDGSQEGDGEGRWVGEPEGVAEGVDVGTRVGDWICFEGQSVVLLKSLTSSQRVGPLTQSIGEGTVLISGQGNAVSQRTALSSGLELHC
jgi:hypothetical protein